VRDAAGSRIVRSVDAGASWADVAAAKQLPVPVAAGLAMPNGDLIVVLAGDAGGVFRLAAEATAFEQLTAAPAHANALYRTGGWIVAAPAWQQLGRPDLESVVSLSPDNGTTWIPIPAAS
jgi:hypothetical protein